MAEDQQEEQETSPDENDTGAVSKDEVSLRSLQNGIIPYHVQHLPVTCDKTTILYCIKMHLFSC